MNIYMRLLVLGAMALIYVSVASATVPKLPTYPQVIVKQQIQGDQVSRLEGIPAKDFPLRKDSIIEPDPYDGLIRFGQILFYSLVICLALVGIATIVHSLSKMTKLCKLAQIKIPSSRQLTLPGIEQRQFWKQIFELKPRHH